jgi:Uma2 family endonuclease
MGLVAAVELFWEPAFMHTTAKFSIATYDRMIEAGVFVPREKHHVELIRGEICEMSPQGIPHAGVLSELTSWSVSNTSRDQIVVRIQSPVQFDDLESVPEPDVVWAWKKDCIGKHPGAAGIVLLIEVSLSSLESDRTVKAELYAEAGIADYWIVNLSQRVVEVYRKPAAGRYQELRTYAVGESVAPLAFPEVRLDVASLWEGCAS